VGAWQLHSILEIPPAGIILIELPAVCGMIAIVQSLHKDGSASFCIARFTPAWASYWMPARINWETQIYEFMSN